jgi:hypothetical protein
MPLQTRNITKGVAPRTHLPKGTKSNSSKSKKTPAKKPTQSRKRPATESDDESQPGDSEPTTKSAKTRKKARVVSKTFESEGEVEEIIDVDSTSTVENVSDVDDEQAGPGSANENEVSTNIRVREQKLT